MCKIVVNPACDREDALSVSQAKAILSAVKRIYEQEYGLDDVVELDNAPGVYRWKPSRSVREFDEVRAVFRKIENGVEIIAAGARSDVYRKASKRLGVRV